MTTGPRYRILKVFPIEARGSSLNEREPIKTVAEYRRSQPAPSRAEFVEMGRHHGLRLDVGWVGADVVVLAYTCPNKEGRGRAGSQLWTLAGRWT